MWMHPSLRRKGARGASGAVLSVWPRRWHAVTVCSVRRWQRRTSTYFGDRLSGTRESMEASLTSQLWSWTAATTNQWSKPEFCWICFCVFSSRTCNLLAHELNVLNWCLVIDWWRSGLYHHRLYGILRTMIVTMFHDEWNKAPAVAQKKKKKE